MSSTVFGVACLYTNIVGSLKHSGPMYFVSLYSSTSIVTLKDVIFCLVSLS